MVHLMLTKEMAEELVEFLRESISESIWTEEETTMVEEVIELTLNGINAAE